MKTLTLSLLLTLIPGPTFANGGPHSSGVNDESIRLKAAQNPRNRAFPQSFNKVGEEREEEQEDLEKKLPEFKDDPFIENYGNSSTTNKAKKTKGP